MKRPTPPTTSGYAAPLGDGVHAALHPDASVTLWGEGSTHAAIHAGQVEELARLLALGAALRSQQRRRRLRNLYLKTFGEEP